MGIQFGLTQQDRIDKITAYLSNNYRDALIQCKTKDEFIKYMKNKITGEYKYSIEKEKKTFNEKLNIKADEFEIDKKRLENADDLESFKKENNDIKKMKELIDIYFEEIRKSLSTISEEDLDKIVKNQIDELENKKKELVNQKNQDSSPNSESSKNDDKKYADYKQLVELYNKYTNEFKSYIFDKIDKTYQEIERMEKLIDKYYDNAKQDAFSEQSEEKFKKYYDEQLSKSNSMFKRLKKEYQNEYDDYIKEKLNKFQSEIDENNINQINLIFFSSFMDAKKKETEEEFKDFYEVKGKGLPDIKYEKLIKLKEKYQEKYREKYQEYLTKFINNSSVINDQKLKKQNVIINFFSTSYDNIKLNSKNEEEFSKKYEERRKNVLKIEDSDPIYKDYLKEYKKKFQDHLVNQFIKNNEKNIVEKSNSINDFKENFEKLKQQSIVNNNYLTNEDYDIIFNNYLLENTKKIQDIIKENQENKINEINSFFNTNKDNFDKCENLEDFEKLAKETASDDLKKLKNFDKILEDKSLEFEYLKIERDCIKECENDISKEVYEDSEIISFLNKISIDDFKDFFKIIYSGKKFDENINKKILNYISKLLQNNRKVNCLNIIICGKTGIGKSTLINSILELENSEKAPVQNELEENDGKPVTIDNKKYKSRKIPYLSIIDTRGTEYNQDNNIEKVLNSINTEIKNAIESKVPDNYIHCIWYCTNPSDGRLEKTEQDFLYELQKSYATDYLPIIIVGTKATSDDFNNKFQQMLINRHINIPFIPVIAVKIDHFPKKGLKELKQKTIEMASKAVESVCYEGLIKEVIADSEKELNEKRVVIEQDIKNNSNNKIQVTKLSEEMKKKFYELINKYLSIKLSDNDEIIKIEQSNEIDEKIKEYISNSKMIYESKFSEKVKKKVENYYKKINEKQKDFFGKNKNKGINLISTEETKMKEKLNTIISGNLKNKYEEYYTQQIYIAFVEKIKNYFSTFFHSCYGDIIKEMSSKQKSEIIPKIAQQFNQLINRLNS